MPTPTQLQTLPPSIPPGEHLPLPGEVSVDAALIDQATAHINAIHTAKGLETARAIGEYLIDTFFDGDLAAFDTRGKKHLSFRALADRDDLQVSASTLWYSVAVLGQLRLLPDAVGAALPLSHHRLLVHVKDESAKVQLAKEAVDEHLPKREFEERVRTVKQELRAGDGRGRPVLPIFAKGITKLTAAVNYACSAPVTAEEVFAFGPNDANLKLAQAKVARDSLTRLIDSLEAGIRSAEAIGEELGKAAAAEGTLDESTEPEPEAAPVPNDAVEVLAGDADLLAFLRPHARTTLGAMLPLAERVAELLAAEALSVRHMAAQLDVDYGKLTSLVRLTKLPDEVKAKVTAGDSEAGRMGLAAALALIKTKRVGE